MTERWRSAGPSLVVMGVSGTGKSTVGAELARRMGREFVEGDDYHPQSNIDKMAAGDALTDEDRWPWLDTLGVLLVASVAQPVVLTCSALKRSYRDLLREGAGQRAILFVHLSGSRETLTERMSSRERHFMPTSLLDSQLDTLEPLGEDEWGVEVDVAPAPDEVIDAAEQAVQRALE